MIHSDHFMLMGVLMGMYVVVNLNPTDGFGKHMVKREYILTYFIH
jgi:hypothetical protein